MTRPFVVVPMGGLCNRLRNILSQRSLHDSIEVLWARSDGVSNASWSDVFEPLDRVTFRDIGVMPAQDYAGPCDQGPCSSAIPDAPPSWTTAYMELRPLPPILARVDELKAMGSPYAAIHARHSDHDENAARFGHVTTNDELLRWFLTSEKLAGMERDGNRNTVSLYLASECKKTIEFFRTHCPSLRINAAWTRQVVNYDERPGTLADAVVDLWMCKDAAAFRGTWISSFSETIALLRAGGAPPGGFDARVHMPSTDAEWFRDRPDRAQAWIKEHQ